MILHGALAFAVPLKFGQTLEVFKNKSDELEWIATEKGDEWLRFVITEQDIIGQTEKGATEKEFVCYLLNRARDLNPEFLREVGVQVKTEIDF